MKKTTKIIIFSIILILLITIISFRISGFTVEKNNYNPNYSWTKAICNETSCQDYVIYCKENRLIEQTPITGATIEIPENWVDPRDEITRNQICDF